MAQQFKVNVYGIKAGRTAPQTTDVYQDSFPATVKFNPDKLPSVPAVYSRIDYVQGGEQMSAFVAETIVQLAALANA